MWQAFLTPEPSFSSEKSSFPSSRSHRFHRRQGALPTLSPMIPARWARYYPTTQGRTLGFKQVQGSCCVEFRDLPWQPWLPWAAAHSGTYSAGAWGGSTCTHLVGSSRGGAPGLWPGPSPPGSSWVLRRNKCEQGLPTPVPASKQLGGGSPPRQRQQKPKAEGERERQKKRERAVGALPLSLSS